MRVVTQTAGAMLRLPSLPSISSIIKLYGLSAKQQLSQNFLLDMNITDRMVRAAGDVRRSTVIEVGSGPGSLTRACLIRGAEKVVAIEKDRRFFRALQAVPDRMNVVMGDAVSLDENVLLQHSNATAVPWDMESRVKIVGNLPFAVSTALLLKWVRQLDRRRGPFAYGRVPMVLTFQAEVADRIVAKPGTKAFGRLSVMVQQSCAVRECFTIVGKSFVPPPDVDARVIYIEPLVTPLASVADLPTLEFLLRELMGYRRKQMGSIIPMLGSGAAGLLAAANIDPKLRSEAVSVEQWCTLANLYNRWPSRADVRPLMEHHYQDANAEYTEWALRESQMDKGRDYYAGMSSGDLDETSTEEEPVEEPQDKSVVRINRPSQNTQSTQINEEMSIALMAQAAQTLDAIKALRAVVTPPAPSPLKPKVPVDPNVRLSRMFSPSVVVSPDTGLPAPITAAAIRQARLRDKAMAIHQKKQEIEMRLKAERQAKKAKAMAQEIEDAVETSRRLTHRAPLAENRPLRTAKYSDRFPSHRSRLKAARRFSSKKTASRRTSLKK